MATYQRFTKLSSSMIITIIIITNRSLSLAGIAMVLTTVVILVNAIFHYWSKFRKAAAAAAAGYGQAGRRFTLAEMEAATENFSAKRILGEGGFGFVYKGFIGNQTVAVKRLERCSMQGEQEFMMEISTSDLKHVNLVPFIGYCRHGKELILVYECMAGGTLADCLYGSLSSSQCISWKQYLKICIGGARGLDYLHTGCGIIHRDVKATNILLDENLVAKIADFGLAKLCNINDNDQSHVSTTVKGTFGYMDPNYAATRKLTTMSDTYAFGVVLLEVLCGQTVKNPKVEEFKSNIIMWGAAEMMSRGEVDLMVNPSLRDEILPGAVKTFLDIVEGCLHTKPEKRPTMAQVVVKLESLLEQHQSPRSMHISTEEGDEVFVPNSAAAGEVVESSSSSELQTNRRAIWRPQNYYILSARNLAIEWSRNPKHWKWVSHPNSRFSEVAELVSVYWLGIQAIINTEMLCSGVNYAAYLVYSFTSDSMAYEFEYPHAETFMGLRNCTSNKKLQYVRLDLEKPGSIRSDGPVSMKEWRRPKKRDDGWMEVELGEYFVKQGESSCDLELSFKADNDTHEKTGLLIEGIEIRPKEKAHC